MRVETQFRGNSMFCRVLVNLIALGESLALTYIFVVMWKANTVMAGEPNLLLMAIETTAFASCSVFCLYTLVKLLWEVRK